MSWMHKFSRISSRICGIAFVLFGGMRTTSSRLSHGIRRWVCAGFSLQIEKLCNMGNLEMWSKMLPVILSAAFSVPSGHVGKRKCIQMSIVDVSSPLSWCQPWKFTFRSRAEQLLYPFILFHCGFESRAIGKPSAGWMVGEKVHTTKDRVQLLRKLIDGNKWVIRVGLNNHLVSVIFSLWLHIVYNYVENWNGANGK